MQKEQFLYRMAEDIAQALRDRDIEHRRKGEIVPKNLILDNWIRLGIEAEKKAV
jgi:hypothetical protein